MAPQGQYYYPEFASEEWTFYLTWVVQLLRGRARRQAPLGLLDCSSWAGPGTLLSCSLEVCPGYENWCAHLHICLQMQASACRCEWCVRAPVLDCPGGRLPVNKDTPAPPVLSVLTSPVFASGVNAPGSRPWPKIAGSLSVCLLRWATLRCPPRHLLGRPSGIEPHAWYPASLSQPRFLALLVLPAITSQGNTCGPLSPAVRGSGGPCADLGGCVLGRMPYWLSSGVCVPHVYTCLDMGVCRRVSHGLQGCVAPLDVQMWKCVRVYIIEFVFLYAREPLRELCSHVCVQACRSGGLQLGGVSCGEVMGETRRNSDYFNLENSFQLQFTTCRQRLQSP